MTSREPLGTTNDVNLVPLLKASIAHAVEARESREALAAAKRRHPSGHRHARIIRSPKRSKEGQ